MSSQKELRRHKSTDDRASSRRRRNSLGAISLSSTFTRFSNPDLFPSNRARSKSKAGAGNVTSEDELGDEGNDPRSDGENAFNEDNPMNPEFVSEIEMRAPAIDDLGVSQIHESLNYVRYTKKDKLPPILMYEINSEGESEHKMMTLRELFNSVNEEAQRIDKEFRESPLFHAYQAYERKERGTDEVDLGIHTVRELRLRDLRRLDFQFNPNEEKLILIRRHAVLIAMDPIRAVVMAGRLILIVPDGADSLLSILDEYMKEWIDETKGDNIHVSLTNHDRPEEEHAPQGVVPFEFHALEALFTTVKSLESQEFSKLDLAVQDTLSYFKGGSLLLPVKIQERMRQQKNELSMMASRISASKKALQELTEDDEEMALMNLTVLSQDPTLYRYPLGPEILARHDEIEELVENYLVDFNSLESKLKVTKSKIQSAEESISLRLDTSQNDLLITSTAITVMSCSIAFGGYIAGAFGMNLDNVITIQDRQYSFMVVTVASFVLILTLFLCIFLYLKGSGILPAWKAAKKFAKME